MRQMLFALGVFALCVPVFAQAETVLRIGEDVSVDDDQVVEGDYYVSVGPFGNTSMSGEVTGDMYAFGGLVTTNGTVGSDLTVIGGASQLHATVTDDVRIIAGEVTLAEHVGGDLFVIGGALKMLSSASVAGDVIFFGGDAQIEGTVEGSILGTSERLRIDGEVGGDVDVKTASLALGQNADITGSVTYASARELSRAQTAVVEGEVLHNPVRTDAQADAKDLLAPLFITLFAVLSLYLLFKKELQVLVDIVLAHPLQSGLCGAAVLVLGPVVSIVLLFTVLGILIGIAGLALSILAYVLAYVLSGIVLGAYLSKLFTKRPRVTLTWICVGTALLYGLLLIPVLGPLLMLILALLSLGGLSLGLYRLLP